MPFALKNIGATYQWLIDKVFNNQIRRNLEAYVNDMVIKSVSEEDMLIDIQGTFDKLRAINMKLNPKKCSFGVKKIPLKRHKEGHLKIEEVYKDIANAYNPNQRRSVGNVSRSLDGKHQRRLARRKRKKTSSYLLLIDKPIKQILTRPEKSGRVAKWATKLGEHDIEFRGRNSIKGQVLADFLAETPFVEDGASSSDGSGVGLMLVSPEEKEYTYAFRFEFETTNNEAKYEVLLARLRIAVDMKARDLSIFVDLQIVANQVNSLFEARQPVIKQYMDKKKEVLKSFNSYSMEHVRRDHKKKSDALSKLASMTFSRLAKEVLVEVMLEKLITRKDVMGIIKEEGSIQAKSIIQEIHQGTCGMHAGSRSMWGIDIVGPLPIAPGGARFLVVAIDYFMKWVKAKPLVSIMENTWRSSYGNTLYAGLGHHE
ncbi:reverse transcriptase domain-containing protein [Tanacetum coccineum]